MKFLAAVLTLSLSCSALAFEKYIGAGANIDTFKSDLPGGYELEDDMGFSPTIGMKGLAFWGNIGFRTGLFLEWKDAQVENSAAPAGEQSIDLKSYYAVVPLNLQFNINEQWAVFGGLAPRVLLAKTCDDCGRFDDDANYFVNFSNAGVTYKFNDKFSMDVNFQHGLSETFDGLKVNTGQLLFFYEI